MTGTLSALARDKVAVGTPAGQHIVQLNDNFM
jgi:hypothetical protein